MNVDELYTKERHEKGSQMQVKDQYGEPKDMYITLAGVDSTAYKKSETELARSVLADTKGDTLAMRAKASANITLSWEGFLDNGKELKFSKEIVEKVYYNAPYLMDQVDLFVSKRINFMKG